MSTTSAGINPKQSISTWLTERVRAAWHGTRIILDQVSPESPVIYDFILELYRECDGRWTDLSEALDLAECDIDGFLVFAATFLQNIGNYYVSAAVTGVHRPSD